MDYSWLQKKKKKFEISRSPEMLWSRVDCYFRFCWPFLETVLGGTRDEKAINIKKYVHTLFLKREGEMLQISRHRLFPPLQQMRGLLKTQKSILYQYKYFRKPKGLWIHEQGGRPARCTWCCHKVHKKMKKGKKFKCTPRRTLTTEMPRILFFALYILVPFPQI